MMRDEWKFKYQVKELLAAAKSKQAFYEDRVRYWEGKKKEVVAAIKSEGIEIDESVAADDKAYISNSFQSRGGSVVVRFDLQKDLHEAHGKIGAHKANVAGYEAWVEVFAAQPPEMILELDQSDWLHFFSNRT